MHEAAIAQSVTLRKRISGVTPEAAEIFRRFE
jgi:hypothetical protein